MKIFPPAPAPALLAVTFAPFLVSCISYSYNVWMIGAITDRRPQSCGKSWAETRKAKLRVEETRKGREGGRALEQRRETTMPMPVLMGRMRHGRLRPSSRAWRKR